jgi:hypothetical protein
VIITYPGLDISLGAVYITSAAEYSDFVTLGTAWFLDFFRLLLFRSGLDFSETFCPAQLYIFVAIQKQRNIVAQPCHKSGFVSRLLSAEFYCGLSGKGTGFSRYALAFYCPDNSANAPYSILYHPGETGDGKEALSVSVLHSAACTLL